MYILGTDPARFTQFYDKVKNDPGWTVHTLPCTTLMQLLAARIPPSPHRPPHPCNDLPQYRRRRREVQPREPGVIRTKRLAEIQSNSGLIQKELPGRAR